MKIYTSIHDKNDREEIVLIPYEKIFGFYLHPELDLALDKNSNVFNTRTGSSLKHTLDKDGRVRIAVKVFKDGKLVNFDIRLHRLVARIFIGRPKCHCDKPFKDLEVNHINGITIDNSIDNLEWCTHKENVNHAFDNNLVNSCKIIYSKHIRTGEVLKHRSISEICRRFNIPNGGLEKFFKEGRHLNNRYKDYLFSFEENYFPKITYEILNPVSGSYECIVVDLIFKNIYILNNLKETSKFLNISKKVIRRHFNKNKRYIKDNFLTMKYYDYISENELGLKII